MDYKAVLDFIRDVRDMGAIEVEVAGDTVKARFMPDFGDTDETGKPHLSAAERAALRLTGQGGES